MNYFKNVLILIFVLFTTTVSAQDILTLENAIAAAMEKNFDIRMANNNLMVAENNKAIQNSGYLPNVTGSANANYANNNAFVVDQQDQEFSIDGIQTSAYGASLGVNYNIYTGGSRKNQFEKLKIAYELSDVQRKFQIDNSLLTVYTTYYAIAQATAQLSILEEAFEISKQRYIRTKYQFDFGQKTNLDVLNAKVDVNNDSLNLINANVQLDNNKRQLNFLMGATGGLDFEVDETVEVNPLLNYDEIRKNMESNNFQTQQIDLNTAMSEYDVKINKAGWLPQVSTNVSYGLNNSQNGPASLFAIQNVNGLNASLNLNWNIFDGGTTNVRVQNAKISLENQALTKEQIQLNLYTELANTWAEYTNQLAILNSEKANLSISEQNFLKTKERYSLGQVTSIDFRQAQLNLINSKVNITNAEFSAKIAEMQLKKLEGTLVER
ncbi:MAG: TolC family protein [Crocinitomicaceae bacterium]